MMKDVIMREMEARAGRSSAWQSQLSRRSGRAGDVAGSLFVTLIVALLRDFGAMQQMPSVVN
jgi:hypothetical protein